MGSYRPLSLLNNDYKIFAKILAKRLEKVIPSLIHIDQVGFIKGRLAANNMRRLFHVMSRASSLQHPAVALSLDAEKAFDRMEWPFLFEVLSKFGFGTSCMKWIKALYNEPMARIKTNGMISHPFQLFRSTRQGCPASPSLFILALEPLASIQKQLKITGISLPSCPISNNSLLTVGGKTLRNAFLSEDINRMDQLVKDGQIIPFSVLKSQYNLKESKIFQYLQLKSIMKNYLTKGIILASKSILEEKLKTAVNKRGTVSVIYKLLIQSLPDSTTSTKLQWDKDIGFPLTAEQWDTILKNQATFQNVAYVTPITLKKMNPNFSDVCWHGCGRTGTLNHMLWTCPDVRTFWAAVSGFIQDLLNVEIPNQFDVCVLGNTTGTLSKTTQRIAALGFMSVKRIILKNWKVRKADCFDLHNWKERGRSYEHYFENAS
uniref:Reverse transcriptase domain-containing protein n=1 Tax=Neogobius melanostomus TaxID=47308 RepID=A0A8C6S6I3_9GOBI